MCIFTFINHWCFKMHPRHNLKPFTYVHFTYVCLYSHFVQVQNYMIHIEHSGYWTKISNLIMVIFSTYDILCFLNKWPPYLHSIFCIWLTCYLLLEACSNPNSHYSHLNLYVLELFNCIECVIILHAILNESSCFFWFKQINHHIWFM